MEDPFYHQLCHALQNSTKVRSSLEGYFESLYDPDRQFQTPPPTPPTSQIESLQSITSTYTSAESTNHDDGAAEDEILPKAALQPTATASQLGATNASERQKHTNNAPKRRYQLSPHRSKHLHVEPRDAEQNCDREARSERTQQFGPGSQRLRARHRITLHRTPHSISTALPSQHNKKRKREAEVAGEFDTQDCSRPRSPKLPEHTRASRKRKMARTVGLQGSSSMNPGCFTTARERYNDEKPAIWNASKWKDRFRQDEKSTGVRECRWTTDSVRR